MPAKSSLACASVLVEQIDLRRIDLHTNGAVRHVDQCGPNYIDLLNVAAVCISLKGTALLLVRYTLAVPEVLFVALILNRTVTGIRICKSFHEHGLSMGYGAAIAVVLFLIVMVSISRFIWKMYRDGVGK